ncbi:MAG TPA: OmpA family protein [Bryobacteraceae bacterium]|jgi:peptidoglycan-associated lipoprotein|nr:OmpA family protein [Bryobacteraceae bacterium]HWB99020.1 OmpA family protein [Bryobacteraceae bacterium]
MKSKLLAGLAATALCLTFTACHKQVAAKAPSAPAPSVAPSQPAASTPSREQAPAQVASNEHSRLPDAATRARIQDLLNRIQDAYFDYDQHTIRPDAQATLQKDGKDLGDILRQYPDFKLTVEGYCDERGSDEYNIALGDARAKQTKDYLANIGVPGDQLRTVSFGRERPVCTDHDEACWQKNRRAHITQAQ